MKKLLLVLLLNILILPELFAQKYTAESLPDSIFSGKQGKFHVQGIAVDKERGYLYFSFTDKLIKTDMKGRLIGSVTGLVGHLGDLTFDVEANKILGSLEYKDDAIGQGISRGLGIENTGVNKFYIAIFDGEKIDKPGMDATKGEVLKTTYLEEVVKDYLAKVKVGNRVVEHRYGCSGIDGITIAPDLGKKGGKRFVYVAYGIYGDTTRDDNDHQVILKYNLNQLLKKRRRLTQNDLHESGPRKPNAKYFVMTGNTTWGTQNLEYDPYTGDFFAAVYKGKKSQFPNYDLFVIDGSKRPVKGKITSDNREEKVEKLSLLQAGERDEKSGVNGWRFKWGATGLFPIGEGLFYISHNKKEGGEQQSTLYKYKWVGSDTEAFKRVDN